MKRKRAATSSTRNRRRPYRKTLRTLESQLALLMILLQTNIDRLITHKRKRR